MKSRGRFASFHFMLTSSTVACAVKAKSISPNIMKPLKLRISHKLVNAQMSSVLHLQVQGLAGESISAYVWPTDLSATKVGAVVEWHGTDMISSIVGAEGEESEWGQRFLLVWAATDNLTVKEIPALGAGSWSKASLSIPDLDGAPGDTVQIAIDAQKWMATLTRAPNVTHGKSLRIPVALRYMNVGPILCEMVSRMLLKKRWLNSAY
jgi:hypothetical protein